MRERLYICHIVVIEHERERLQINWRRPNGYSNIADGYTRSNVTGWGSRPFCNSHPADQRERERERAPLSLALVNAHVLTEIVVATERLIATRERTQKRWLQAANQHSSSVSIRLDGEEG